MSFIRLGLSAAGGAVMLALAWAGAAQAASIVGSDHDILFVTGGSAVFGTGTTASVQICNFCHTPHFAQATEPPLWNRSAPTTTSWTMYSSPTMDATVPAAPQGVSLGCLSCHDGATALDAGTGLTLTVAGKANPTMTDLVGLIGTDPDHIIAPGGNLSDDHPISIQYGLDANLHPVTVTGTGRNVVSGPLGDVPLFGVSGDQVECASCHNPHDPGNRFFLRISNNNPANPSGLCLTCHDK